MGTNRRYAEELAYVNAVSCLLVILIHVLSLGISMAEPTSWQLAVIYFPWRLSAFVVPAFLFSGGVKMSLAFGDRFDGREYVRYLWGRVKKIYLPYLVWNIIYYVCFMGIGYVRGELSELLRYILVGNLTSPFYYIIIVMQFYLLQPLWFWLVKRIPWYIGGICAVLITFLSLQGNSILNLFGVSFGYWDRVFTSYLIFWVLGLYVGRRYTAFTRSLCKAGGGMVLAAGTVLVFTLMAYVQYSRKVYFFDLGPSKIFTDCLSILILLWVSRKLVEGTSKLKGILRYIHGASFFVYLCHCLFLTLGTHYLQVYGVNNLTILLICRFVICYTLPFLTYELWRRGRKLLKS